MLPACHKEVHGLPKKQLTAFGLDGTLAESKQAIDPEMASLLGH